MDSLVRSRQRLTRAAFALAALSLAACAGTFASPAASHSTSARTEHDVVEPTRGDQRERSPSDSEYPPISVEAETGDRDGTSPVRDSERSDARLATSLLEIDQYPRNPRCYAAGRYIPAPPLCPGP